MRIRNVLMSAMTIVMAGALSAQLGAAKSARRSDADNRPRANQGHIPATPLKETAHEAEHGSTGHVNDTPHVNHNHWYGHERSDDPRFHLDHPFEHGRFVGFGPSFRYNLMRVDHDRHMFWLPGGAYFQIAAWDWPFFADWCWNCGDDFMVYEDPGHPGWYMVYNVHTGQYVHATYMGM